MSAPIGAEVCGCEFTPDGQALFLALQHPGEAGSATLPQSHWPDGGVAAPRPSVIVIEPESRSRRFGS
jgi:secreted PhoX family phosphatase